MEKEYRLKGCMSSKGYGKIKDGDIVPAGWFTEADFAKMLEKGRIVEVSIDEIPDNDPEDNTSQTSDSYSEEIDIDQDEVEDSKDKLSEATLDTNSQQSSEESIKEKDINPNEVEVSKNKKSKER